MIESVARAVLHVGEHGGGPVSFETVLGVVVALLVVVGTLYYVGAVGASDGPADQEPESGVGD